MGSSVKAKDVKELVALSKSTKGGLSYASAGTGSIAHLAGELLKARIGIDMLHIPYKGASVAITELIGGQIIIYGSSMPPALPLINAGKLRALGVSSAKRLAPLPSVRRSISTARSASRHPTTR